MANVIGTLATGSNLSTSGTTFAGGGEAALAELIKLLQGGGTPEMQASKTQRQEEITAVRNQRGDYTKGAAFADAQAAMAAQQREALRELLPSINAAAAGSGTSRSSMRALLLQDAAQKSADSAATLGLKAASDYGNISTSLSAVLENLTRMENPQTEALLQALQISKGQQSSQNSGGTVASQSTRPSGGVAYGAGTSTSPWDSMYQRYENEERYNDSLALRERQMELEEAKFRATLTPTSTSGASSANYERLYNDGIGQANTGWGGITF